MGGKWEGGQGEGEEASGVLHRAAGTCRVRAKSCACETCETCLANLHDAAAVLRDHHLVLVEAALEREDTDERGTLGSIGDALVQVRRPRGAEQDGIAHG